MSQRAAVIDVNGTVLNVIVVADANSAVDFGAIACDPEVSFGWTYDPDLETWTAPPAPDPEPLTVDDVADVRLTRLSAGFDYDFADARGVHTIATTRADMEGWREVNDLANAAINKGLGNTEINILTETGLTTVTADEWQDVLIAAHAWRQVVWSKSFEIAAMDPIPLDIASNNDLWTV